MSEAEPVESAPSGEPAPSGSDGQAGVRPAPVPGDVRDHEGRRQVWLGDRWMDVDTSVVEPNRFVGGP